MVLFATVDVSDLRTDDGSGDLLSSVRTRIGPALGRAFDDLHFDDTQCASCHRPVGPGLAEVDDRDRPVWRPATLVANVTTGRSWALCEDCTAAIDPPEPT